MVDSSVVVKWFVVEPYSTEARRALDTYQNGVLSFLAPDLINAEFGNIIWKKHILQGLFAFDAQDILDKFGSYSLPLRQRQNFSKRHMK